MTAVGEENTSLVAKCMEFCQVLASQGQAFNFSLAIGPDFSFSLDTARSKVMKESRTKKKASPSTLRRNAKRREEFAKKKQNSSVRTTTEDDAATSNSLSCDQCEVAFKTRNGLKIHKGKSHKETTKSPEKLREASSPGSPLKFCEEEFNCEEELQNHKAAGCSKQFVCKTCNVDCLDYDGRWRHEIQFHG